jgi:SAM-dependent methyltransferase
MAGFGGLFEACRQLNLHEELSQLDIAPERILDYGCGQGRYLDLLRERYPDAALIGADVSTAGLERASERHPEAQFVVMQDERLDVPDASVDVVLSVEVLEHVADVRVAISEIARVLRAGGVAVITTPCANRWSLEWVLNRLWPNGTQDSPDGYGRYASDEPGHLRRLQSRDLDILLRGAGLSVDHFSFRAHLFTTLASIPVAPLHLRMKLAMLDWRLWRQRSNAATMIATARKLDGGESRARSPDPR